MFNGFTAWFSESVDEEKIQLWCDKGGLLDSSEVADYLFSEDATYNDTKQIFETKPYLDEELSVFHPEYICRCVKHGGMNKINIGKYFFPPEEIHVYMRDKEQTFGWEEEDTDVRSVGLFPEFDEVNNHAWKDDYDDRYQESDEDQGFDQSKSKTQFHTEEYEKRYSNFQNFLNKSCVKQANMTTTAKTTHSPCQQNKQTNRKCDELSNLETTVPVRRSPRQRHVPINKTCKELSNMNNKVPVRRSPRQCSMPTNKTCNELSNLNTKVPGRRSPLHRNKPTNKTCKELSNLNTKVPTRCSPRLRNLPTKEKLSKLNVTGPTRRSHRQQNHSSNQSPKQLELKHTENKTMKMQKLKKRRCDISKTNQKYQETPGQDGIGVSTRKKAKMVDKSANEHRHGSPDVADQRGEKDGQRERPKRNMSFHLLDGKVRNMTLMRMESSFSLKCTQFPKQIQARVQTICLRVHKFQQTQVRNMTLMRRESSFSLKCTQFRKRIQTRVQAICLRVHKFQQTQEVFRLQDLKKVSGRVRPFQQGKNGCKCVGNQP